MDLDIFHILPLAPIDKRERPPLQSGSPSAICPQAYCSRNLVNSKWAGRIADGKTRPRD